MGNAIMPWLIEDVDGGIRETYIPSNKKQNIKLKEKIMDENLTILVTYINKKTFETFKYTVTTKRDTPLGQNFKFFREEDVIPLFPKPNNDENLVIINVEEIDGVLQAEY